MTLKMVQGYARELTPGSRAFRLLGLRSCNVGIRGLRAQETTHLGALHHCVTAAPMNLSRCVSFVNLSVFVSRFNCSVASCVPHLVCQSRFAKSFERCELSSECD